MKIRNGFVSNSSSSSFVIYKKDLRCSCQVEQIKNHSKLGKEMGMGYADESWAIVVDDSKIVGSTWMDNFEMKEFLEKIGINMKKIKWSDDLR